MSVERREEDGQRIYSIRLGSGVRGHLVVDSSVAGRARGGLRVVSDASEAETRAAARAMTLKYGFLGLPQGGAKAAVAADDELPEREKRALLAEFAGEIRGELESRTYVPDSDLGTRSADIRAMLGAIGMRLGRREWRSDRSGAYTADSCCAAAEVLMRRRGGSLAGARVAIEGFGRVGSSLAARLADRGARVTSVSTSRGALHAPDGLDVDRLLRLGAQHGSGLVDHYPEAERLAREALFAQPVDLLCPCARHHGIQADNAGHIRARVVCAGANDPVSPEAEKVLFERGIAYPPDFVTNCGGVLGGTLEFTGLTPERVSKAIKQWLPERVDALMDRAERDSIPPRRLAEAEALARHERVRERALHPSLAGRAVEVGIELHRRGLVPRRVVAALAPRYLESLGSH